MRYGGSRYGRNDINDGRWRQQQRYVTVMTVKGSGKTEENVMKTTVETQEDNKGSGVRYSG